MLSFISGLTTVLAATDGEHHANGKILPGDMNEVYWGSLAFFIVLIVWYAVHMNRLDKKYGLQEDQL